MLNYKLKILFSVNLIDALNHLIGYFGRQVLRGVVEHGGADAVLTASAMQHVDIYATFTTFPESLVLCKVGKGHGLIA